MLTLWPSSLLLSFLAVTLEAGTYITGDWFPSLYAHATDPSNLVKPGNTTTGSAAGAIYIRDRIMDDLSRVAELYIDGPRLIFCAEGGIRLAAYAFSALANNVGLDVAKLRHVSVSPWYWVEPTSLLPKIVLESPAEKEGFASICDPNGVYHHKCWEAITPSGITDYMPSSFFVKMRSVRTSLFLAHHKNNAAVQAALRISALDPNAVINPIVNADHPDVATRLTDENGFLSLINWSAACAFPPPSLFINLGKLIGVTYTLENMTADGFPVADQVM